MYQHYDIVICSQTSWRWLEAKLTALSMIFATEYKLFFVLDRTSMFPVTSRKNGTERTHEVKASEIIWRKFSNRRTTHTRIPTRAQSQGRPTSLARTPGRYQCAQPRNTFRSLVKRDCKIRTSPNTIPTRRRRSDINLSRGTSHRPPTLRTCQTTQIEELMPHDKWGVCGDSKYISHIPSCATRRRIINLPSTTIHVTIHQPQIQQSPIFIITRVYLNTTRVHTSYRSTITQSPLLYITTFQYSTVLCHLEILHMCDYSATSGTAYSYSNSMRNCTSHPSLISAFISTRVLCTRMLYVLISIHYSTPTTIPYTCSVYMCLALILDPSMLPYCIQPLHSYMYTCVLHLSATRFDIHSGTEFTY